MLGSCPTAEWRRDGHAHLVEGVGEVARDRVGAAVADEMDDRRRGECGDRAVEHRRVDGARQPLERVAAGIDELGEEGLGMAAARGAEVAQPGRVVRPLARILLAEEPLHLAEAGEAELLAEAHHRRRLHLGGGRHLGDGGDRHPVRVPDDVVRALAQALRQVPGAAAERLEEGVERLGGRPARGMVHAGSGGSWEGGTFIPTAPAGEVKDAAGRGPVPIRSAPPSPARRRFGSLSLFAGGLQEEGGGAGKRLPVRVLIY